MEAVMTDTYGIQEALKALGLKEINEGTSTGSNNFGSGETISSYSPTDGSLIGKVTTTTKEDYEKVMATATAAYQSFREMPAPQRGELVRQFGNKLRELKEPLGKLVSYEMGKSLQEGYGEVQEMIDICDFAVGLSRQLNGQTIPSERPGHVMREQWHSIGVVGIISAFNFPVAVWAWNTALAWICGDTCVWKGSEKAPLCTIACQNIAAQVFKDNNLPEGISCIINGDYKVGEMMTTDERIPLVSATGSTRMGRIVGATVAQRFGKSLLELGGNNAIIITPTADLKVVVPGAVFGAVGTCGQRCTSTRRLIIHESVYDTVKDAIIGAYGQLTIGNPLDEKNHIGPLIDKDAVNMYLAAIESAKAEGGTVLVEGGVLEGEGYESGCYVK
ncbi:MAG: aldehyde dehydrogenase family protein, partial [Flavobacteriales bacterium]|nr:aldehyde dehydrogenase family protein [Flavobacteriales bacterium]